MKSKIKPIGFSLIGIALVILTSCGGKVKEYSYKEVGNYLKNKGIEGEIVMVKPVSGDSQMVYTNLRWVVGRLDSAGLIGNADTTFISENAFNRPENFNKKYPDFVYLQIAKYTGTTNDKASYYKVTRNSSSKEMTEKTDLLVNEFNSLAAEGKIEEKYLSNKEFVLPKPRTYLPYDIYNNNKWRVAEGEVIDEKANLVSAGNCEESSKFKLLIPTSNGGYMLFMNVYYNSEPFRIRPKVCFFDGDGFLQKEIYFDSDPKIGMTKESNLITYSDGAYYLSGDSIFISYVPFQSDGYRNESLIENEKAGILVLNTSNYEFLGVRNSTPADVMKIKATQSEASTFRKKAYDALGKRFFDTPEDVDGFNRTEGSNTISPKGDYLLLSCIEKTIASKQRVFYKVQADGTYGYIVLKEK